ncbi:hypothetical protein MVEG_05253 [Podila verticillata NRRL 6337]|nr:MAG: hypothetical protein BYD32DRAFT_412952 [Podila humilis]KFH68438.1 hypothetical protein MVEG_05253 [Podila verticillata NRRL 6337]
MGLFAKPLLSAHYDNEDVQISAELCSNIAINIIGLAKGEITILSGNDDMIHINTSVQAREAIIKNAAALEPMQDGNQYTYTIHTPLEEKLERAVTFQVFITIPRHLDSLESFTIHGANIELAVGNISHTFIKNFNISNSRGDISIDSFYGESATIVSHTSGGITGKYSVARLYATTKGGRINSQVHLLNTDDQLPAPKVICCAMNFRLDLQVDGTDLFGPFTVEAKTQTSPLDVKILLAGKDQRLLGNFINFGGPARIRLSGNYQGRVETRTHYGKIHLDEPEFIRLDGASLTIPSLSDRVTFPSVTGLNKNQQLSPNNPSLNNNTTSQPSSVSTVLSSKSSSHGTSMSTSWESDWQNHAPALPTHNGRGHHPHHHHHHNNNISNNNNSNNNHLWTPSSPTSSSHDSGSNHSKAGSTNGSFTESRSIGGTSLSLKEKDSRTEKQRRKDEEKDSVVTREMIGTIGQGPGLVMVKNSSGDIHIELI